MWNWKTEEEMQRQHRVDRIKPQNTKYKGTVGGGGGAAAAASYMLTGDAPRPNLLEIRASFD